MLNIIKKENNKNYVSILLNDNKYNITFWIDTALMDGFGNKPKKNTSKDDLFVEWDFNQYIFNLDNSEDLRIKSYQEDEKTFENINDFIDEKNSKIVNYFIKEGILYYED